jgi:hypothetical protein
MIGNRIQKKTEIIETIKNRIGEINLVYRSGPDLYFYKRLNFFRNHFNNIIQFLNDNYNLEILYATLVSWDMNSRAAKMKYFDDFKYNLISCYDNFIEIENYQNLNLGYATSLEIKRLLEKVYKKIAIMKTNSRLVSNSKLLHFLFPTLCIPMDGLNTLNYIYNNTNESIKKYLEIVEFSFEIINSIDNWAQYLDNNMNASAPKLVDNAIILLVGRSINRNN